jgi:hypothetical protein
MSVYVGIDVHRKRSQVAVVAEDGKVQLNKNVVNGTETLLRLIAICRLARRRSRPRSTGPRMRISRPAKNWPGWMSTRSAGGTPGIAGPHLPCSPWRSCPSPPPPGTPTLHQPIRSRSPATRSPRCSAR